MALSILANSQTIQKGLVRKMNSGKEPLSGVMIQYVDANTTDSDNNGEFTLEFKRYIAPGQNIFLEKIEKSGYELVNEKEVQILKLSNDHILEKDIILAESGKINEAKLEYVGASITALNAGLEREKRMLLKQFKELKVSQEEYIDQLEFLQQDFDNQKEQLDALADKFARTNFDDVDPEYEESLELFKEGRIKEAIAKLENIDLISRTEAIIKEYQKIENLEEEVKTRKMAIGVEKEKQITMLGSLADMYGVDFDFLKAETSIEQLLQLDSTDIKILQVAASFYNKQVNYEKAKNTYIKIVENKNSGLLEKANAMFRLGDIYQKTGNNDEALSKYKISSLFYSAFYMEINSTFYLENLKTIYSRIAHTYSILGDYENSIDYLNREHDLSKELIKAFPYETSYKSGLAVSYQNIGLNQSSMGDYDQAILSFENFNMIMKELVKSLPNNSDFKLKLAISHQFLGTTHREIGNLDSALKHINTLQQISKDLCENYPDDILFNSTLSLSYQHLGNIYAELEENERALSHYTTFNNLARALYEKYPQNMEFKKELAISYQYLGTTLYNLDKHADALNSFELFHKLAKELYQLEPNNTSLKSVLASSFEKMGTIYLQQGKLNYSLDYFENSNQLRTELYKQSPINIDFKNALSLSSEQLGKIHINLGNLDTAMHFYTYHNEIAKEIFKSTPKNIRYKLNLANSYLKLGILQLENRPSLGLNTLDTARIIYRQLIEKSDQNPNLKRALEFIEDNLNDIYGEVSKLESQKIIEKINESTDNKQLFLLYNFLIEALKNENADDKSLASALNSCAWYGLLSGYFKEAEILLREGINLFPQLKYLHLNLAPSLLLQGKIPEAIEEYKNWANVPFGDQGYNTYGDAFLNVLNTYKKEAIIPKERKKDVENIKRMLNEK